jgi:hypothetical protein
MKDLHWWNYLRPRDVQADRLLMLPLKKSRGTLLAELYWCPVTMWITGTGWVGRIFSVIQDLQPARVIIQIFLV